MGTNIKQSKWGKKEEEGRENELETSHEEVQLDVRTRALMSLEEIKCPCKGLDSCGLCCFLSRAPPCDNCFSIEFTMF